MTTLILTSTTAPLFQLGQIVGTPEALASCSPEHVAKCLQRHAGGDWGSICEEDKLTNAEALADGYRLLSAYPINPDLPSKGYGENVLWIITEADRSVTTILLTSEY